MITGRANGAMWRSWRITEASAKGCDRRREISQVGISLRHFIVIPALRWLFAIFFCCLPRKIGRIWYNGDTKVAVGLTDTLEYDARLVLMTRRAFIYYYISKGEFYGEQDASI